MRGNKIGPWPRRAGSGLAVRGNKIGPWPRGAGSGVAARGNKIGPWPRGQGRAWPRAAASSGWGVPGGRAGTGAGEQGQAARAMQMRAFSRGPAS
ncbi:hypothetical protein Abr02nite_79570 [Paractinoplanes brasiliensis]|nr:hypothetical protein Abr02nite_79570 [Actinoplanes brasiliensis]